MNTEIECLLHGDRNCPVCYPVRSGTRPVRPIPKRVTLSSAIKPSVEERVNFKVLIPILHPDELSKHPELVDEPLTEQEVDYLLRRSING